MTSVCIYSIYDVKAGMYGPAMSFVNDATAIRAFQEMICSGDNNSLLALYPADYILFCIGTYDQSAGLLTALPAPNNIISGMQAFTQACNEAAERRARAERLKGIALDRAEAIKESSSIPVSTACDN